MSRYEVEPEYQIEKGCRCCSCWEPTGKWLVCDTQSDAEDIICNTKEEADVIAANMESAIVEGGR